MGLSHTACYGSTEVKLAVPDTPGKGIGVSLTKRNKETLHNPLNENQRAVPLR